MAKQKNHNDLTLDLSDLLSEAEKAVEKVIESPKDHDEEFSIEVDVDISDDSSDDLDLDAELAALEGLPQRRSELDILREELEKAKKIIRLQKTKLKEKHAKPAVSNQQIESFTSEIAHLKNRIKEGHRAQITHKNSMDELNENLTEERERSKQLRGSYSNMRKKAEELKTTAEQLQTRLRRVQERRKKDVEDNKKFGCTPAVKAIIPAIENLERALNFPDVDKESLIKGVRLSLEQLAQDLSKIGINRVPTSAGTEFDPSIHEAIQRVPSSSISEGCIVQEISVGFTLNSRLIRAAKVAVAIAEPTTEHQETEQLKAQTAEEPNEPELPIETVEEAENKEPEKSSE